MKLRTRRLIAFAALATAVLLASTTRAQASDPAQMSEREFDRTFTHRTADVNGVKMHYVTGGKGDPVVLLHGFPQTWRAWRKVMPTLAARYTVIAPDLRGMGDSAQAATGYAKKIVAEDIYQLARSLGHERFYLVGHDFGGSVAFALTAAHPEAVRRLVLMECLPAGLLTPEETQSLLPTKFKSKSWFQGFHQTPDLPEELIAGRERIYLGWLFDSFAVNRRAINDEDINEYVRAYSRAGAIQSALGYYRSGAIDAENNRPSRTRKLTMPILVFGGDGSMGETPIRAIRAAATNVRGEVLRDTGHFVPEERAEIISPKIIAFFAEG